MTYELRAKYDSIKKSAEMFKRVGVEYKAKVPGGGFTKASTGGGEMDQALDTVLWALWLAHNAAADVAWQHGEKLGIVIENLRNSEDKTIANFYTEATERTPLATSNPKAPEDQQ